MTKLTKFLLWLGLSDDAAWTLSFIAGLCLGFLFLFFSIPPLAVVFKAWTNWWIPGAF